MAKLIIKWKKSLLGGACKFDVYLMNNHIGELKCGSTLEASVDVGVYTIFFKEKRKFGKKANASFEVVVNEENETVELRTKFDMNGNFTVKYADNAPHIPAYGTALTQPNLTDQTNIPDQELRVYPNEQKKKSGCLTGCLTTIVILLVITLVVAIALVDNDTSGNEKTTQTEQSETVLYSDDDFKITFVDFQDPDLGVTSYNLILKIENNSDQTVIVSPSDGYANDEAVFLGSGMPVKVKPNKKATGGFVVGYGNTGIQSIDEIETLELKLTLYDETFSKEVLTLDDLVIHFK